MNVWDQVIVTKEKHPHVGRAGYVVAVQNPGQESETCTVQLDGNTFANLVEESAQIKSADMKKL